MHIYIYIVLGAESESVTSQFVSGGEDIFNNNSPIRTNWLPVDKIKF